MSFKDICIELLTNPNSPFKGNIWGNFSVSGMLYDVINIIAYAIAHLLKIILDGMNDFAISAYRFMTFSESSTVRGLYDLLAKYIWIPVLLCGTIACFRILFGGKGVGKQFIRNLGYLFVAVAILPSVFSYINRDVFGGYRPLPTAAQETQYKDNTLFAATVNNENESITDEILRSNTVDKVWLYDQMVKGGSLSNLDSVIKTFDHGKTADSIEGWGNFASAIASFNGMGSLASAYSSTIASLIPSNETEYYGEKMLASSGVSSGDLDSLFKTLKSPTMRENWINSSAAKELTLDDGGISVNEKISEYISNEWNSDTGSETDTNTNSTTATGYTDGIPNLLKMKVNRNPALKSSGVQNQKYLAPLSDGTDLLGIIGGTPLGKESYWRYNIDWFNIYIEILAHIYVFFIVGYCAVKLIMELIVHQIFGGIMAAMDLNGGDRIRKFLTAIIGCYIGLLLGIMVIPLFNGACSFITNNMGIESGFIKALLEIVLATVIVTVPNMIAMYFGVNTGVIGGNILAGGMAKIAMKTAKAAGKVVGNAASNNMRGFAGVAQTVRANTDKSNRVMEQEAERNHALQREQVADQRYEQQQASQAERERSRAEREREQNIRNERNDLSSNSGMSNLSDEAHGRNANFDYSADEQRREALGNVASEAERNGGTREAYMAAAEKELKSGGAISPTQETISYTADAAKMHHEQSAISDNVNNNAQANTQAVKEVMKDWGASDRNIETASEHNFKAESIPKKQNNKNLKT